MYVNGYKYALKAHLQLIIPTQGTTTSMELKIKRIEIEETPQELFSKVQSMYEDAFLLESSTGVERLADFSFVGFNPILKVVSWGNRTVVHDLVRRVHDESTEKDPLEVVKRYVRPDTFVSPFRFGGGAVGYISYEASRYWEKLPSNSKPDLGFPTLEFGIYNDGIVFDHRRNMKFYWYIDKNRLDDVSQIISAEIPQETVHFSEPERSMTKDLFAQLVEKAKSYISSGDIFQVVLSKRFDLKVDGDLNLFYSELSRLNPSPYMFFLKFGERKIIGSSPEMLVRVDEGQVETYPIAGTRPRLDDPQKNELLSKELINDPKEMAEHTMLVDLARNDVGKVSIYGTVKVPEFGIVHQFSHVQHIVSHVTGVLRPGLDCYDVIKAVFPAGTVSGAPKVRAMEIIEELEPEHRGPYAGAVGYFSYNGNADFAITIRTLVANGCNCSIQAGAGIVADSQPEREWYETESKAMALIRAAKLAGDKIL
jgi:anthranilate synthase component 1